MGPKLRPGRREGCGKVGRGFKLWYRPSLCPPACSVSVLLVFELKCWSCFLPLRSRLLPGAIKGGGSPLCPYLHSRDFSVILLLPSAGGKAQ